jgi:hypothetical protein
MTDGMGIYVTPRAIVRSMGRCSVKPREIVRRIIRVRFDIIELEWLFEALILAYSILWIAAIVY